MLSIEKHEDWEEVKGLCQVLLSEGHEALLAGGCVRDTLLGRQINDFDIATSASPKQVQKLFEKVLLLGEAFGVAAVVLDNKTYELTRFRKDGPSLNHRHPENVVFADKEEDALRRDFTVNALFLDPQTLKVIDFVGGLKDLKDKKLRTVGSPMDRFSEDYLRPLRGLRFAAQLGFSLENETYKAIKKHRTQLSELSAERVQVEIKKCFEADFYLYGLQLLRDTGYLHAIFPRLAFESDLFNRLKLSLTHLGPEAHFCPRLALLYAYHLLHNTCCKIHDVESVQSELQNLKISKKEQKEILYLVKGVVEFRNSTDSLDLLKTLDHEQGLKLVELLQALNQEGVLQNHKLNKILNQYRELMTEVGFLPDCLVTGADLVPLGLRGKAVGEALKQVYEAQLMGVIKTKEEALVWINQS